MKKEYLYGILGLLGGAVITLVFATSAVNGQNVQMMKMMGMHTANTSVNMPMGRHMMTNGDMMNDEDNSMTMNGMVDSLKDKSGDEFDKTFIEEMIPHHQGAIDMAKLAEKNAKHEEIKNLAKDIISAQTKEINTMKEWQVNWGY